MFGEKLRSARLACGLRQSELAQQLNLRNTTISNWEKGISNPDVEFISPLCKILGVSASYFFEDTASKEILSYSEKEHLEKYRNLDEDGKKTVDYVLNDLYTRCTILKEDIGYYAPVMKPSYQASLSAGTGLFVFDDLPIDQIEVPADYDYIDFVIGVNGDSMEPTYLNGDKVMVVKQSSIHTGEIGAFMVDGEAFIKELGDNCLISHNKKYLPLQFEEGMRIDCIGKVVGKL